MLKPPKKIKFLLKFGTKSVQKNMHTCIQKIPYQPNYDCNQ